MCRTEVGRQNAISFRSTSHDSGQLTFRARMSSEGTGAIAAGGDGIAAGEVVFWTDIVRRRSGSM